MKFRLRAYNFLLFIRALFSVVRFGTRKKIPRNPKKVLVIQLAKLGDMVCITPVLHALRTARPEVTIYVLGDALNKSLLEESGDVDTYIVYKPGTLIECIAQIRSEKIDVVCVRGTPFIGLVIALLSGIPAIIASRIVEGKGFETRTYKWLLPFVYTVDFKLGEYMPRQFLRLLEPLGILSNDTTKHLRFSHGAESRIAQFFLEQGLDPRVAFVVGITPTAGNKIKEWPLERFAEVMDHLIEKQGATVLLIGGPGDAEKVTQVIKRTKYSEKIVNTQGKFTMDETKALISKCSLFISVDTGPIYIAEAFGVPTIDIVGPVDEREQPPQGDLHRNIVPPGRVKPELSILNSRMYNPEEALRQTLSITAVQVLAEVDRLIEDIRSSKHS